MTEPKAIEQHGSRTIAALEHAWAAIQDQHPDVPDVVIVTGAGSNKGTPEGYRLRGHHWPNDGSSKRRTDAGHKLIRRLVHVWSVQARGLPLVDR